MPTADDSRRDVHRIILEKPEWISRIIVTTPAEEAPERSGDTGGSDTSVAA